MYAMSYNVTFIREHNINKVTKSKTKRYHRKLISLDWNDVDFIYNLFLSYARVSTESNRI